LLLATTDAGLVGYAMLQIRLYLREGFKPYYRQLLGRV
jgi:hypothetical protein